MLDKVDSGGSWAPFGRGLGRSGPPLGHFWALFGRYLGVLNQPFFKHRSKMESKRPFGSILEGFWEDSGRLWEGFGKGLGRIWEDFFSFSANLGHVSPDHSASNVLIDVVKTETTGISCFIPLLPLQQLHLK